jgi:hypothetical protein
MMPSRAFLLCNRLYGHTLLTMTLLWLMLGWLVLPTQAATINVVNGGCTLADAIIAANTNAPSGSCSAGSGDDTIEIPAGTYQFTTAHSGDNALPAISSNITFAGAGTGNTIIRRITTSPEFRLFEVTSGTVQFQNMTIQNGDTDEGGAIFITGGNVTVDNVIFRDNQANISGGAIALQGGTLNVNNSTFNSNVSQSGLLGGGAIHVENSATSLDVLQSNFVSNLSVGAGGAIYNQGVASNVTSSTFTGNIASNQGGGIHQASGSLNVTNSTFSTNVASDGGAIYTQSGNLSLITSTVNDNSSTTGGAGLSMVSGTHAITQSTISNNQSTNGVGGVQANGGTVNIVNSTLSGNRGQSGAFIILSGASLNVNFSTIYDNTRQGNASSHAGGIRASNATVTLNKSIVGNNSNTDCLLTSSTATGNNNLIQGTCGTSGSDGIPTGIQSLANNGGFTRTHALLPTSNAISATSCDGLAIDQRTQPRPKPDGTNCDIGAFELQTTDRLLTISPTTLDDGYVGLGYSEMLTVTGGVGGYTWSSTDEPVGLTLNANGTITGTPTSAGDNQTFTANVEDEEGNTGSAVITISIKATPDLELTPTLLPFAKQAETYNETVSVSGGSGNYTFVLVGAPAGLGIGSTSGQFSGSINTAGNYAFQIQVTDTDLSYMETFDVTLEVKAQPTFSVSTINPGNSTLLPDARVNESYSAPVYINGGTPPYTLNVTLKPSGMNLVPDGNNALVTGTPTEGGAGGAVFQFEFTLADADGFVSPPSTPFSITIEIDDQPIVTTTTLPDGARGVFYSTTLEAEGGFPNYSFRLASGSSVPDGLNLQSNGTLRGTPNPTGGFGPFTFFVIARDSKNVDSVATLVTINISEDPVVVVAPTEPINSGNGRVTLPQGALTVNYTQTFTASGGISDTYTYTQTGTLPTGMTFTDGVLSGTPTATGVFTFEIQAEDTDGNTGTTNYELEVLTDPVITIEPTTLPTAYTNVPYSTSLSASGGTAPYTYASSNLPAGLSINGSNITGTPTGSGTVTFDVIATDANGKTGTTPLQLTIGTTPPLEISPNTLPAGEVGTAYSATLTASNGDGSYTFSTIPVSPNPLPPGLTLNSSGGIGGTPTSEGTSTFTVIVTDGNGLTATKDYSITIGRQTNVVYVSSPVPSTAIDLGVSALGSTVSASVVVSEGGTDPLTVTLSSDTAIIGDDAGVFAVGGDELQFTIDDGGASRSIVVSCTPAEAIIYNATLVVNTNDPSQPSASYPLSCGGVRELEEGESQYALPVTPTTIGRVFFVRGLAHRTGPYLGATMLGILRPDNDYPVYGKSDDEGGEYTWYLIEANDEIGWASGRYLEVLGSDQIPVVQSEFELIDNAQDLGVRGVTYTNLHVRVRPSTRSAILATTEWGAEFVLLGRTRQAGMDQWYHVRYTTPDNRTITGWVAAEWIQVTSPIDVDATPIR